MRLDDNDALSTVDGPVLPDHVPDQSLSRLQALCQRLREDQNNRLLLLFRLFQGRVELRPVLDEH